MIKLQIRMLSSNYMDNFSNNKLKPNKTERIANPIIALVSSDRIIRSIHQLFTIVYPESKL